MTWRARSRSHTLDSRRSSVTAHGAAAGIATANNVYPNKHTMAPEGYK
jgi:hypothetical protein